MSFEQSVLHLPLMMSVHQERAKWTDQVSVKEELNEVTSIKQAFSLKVTPVKAINKSSHLKVIGQRFLSKIKKPCQRSSWLVLQLIKSSLHL